MTQKNVKFFSSVSKSCPEIGFLTGKFVQLSQNAAFQDHIENVAALNVMLNSGETLVINTHHLLWVTVQGCSLHLNDKCMATFFLGGGHFPMPFKCGPKYRYLITNFGSL